ncbi:MAG: GNAT family N-acetyltransferase [Sediminibacterium sp.]|nr:GNAT family N-acetyltransferase [Sediminibacterium sp.]
MNNTLETEKIQVRILSKLDVFEISNLGLQLNPDKSFEEIKQYSELMFEMENYICFGLVKNNQIIGISSGWTTIRFYSGKQLEIDNVVISKEHQSKKYGNYMLSFIESWAKERAYKYIELNTLVQNTKSHKFYYNFGFEILGYHFVKKI